MKRLKVISKHSTQVGPVTVNFTVGRIAEPSPADDEYEATLSAVADLMAEPDTCSEQTNEGGA